MSAHTQAVPVLDGIARSYQQALLLANGLRSDLLDSTLHDSRGDLISDVPGASNIGAMGPSSTFSAIQYPAGPGAYECDTYGPPSV